MESAAVSLKDLVAAPRGAVVVSPDSFPDFGELRGRFSVLGYINLCAGIDTAVLHPRLYALNLYDDQDNPVQTALLSEGVLTRIHDDQLLPVSSSDQLEAWLANPLTRHLAVVLTLVQRGALTLQVPPGGEDVFADALAHLLDTCRMLFVEPRLPLPLSPTATQASFLHSHPLLGREEAALYRAATSLQKVYGDLAVTLAKLTEELHGPGLAFPPLALQALDKASSPAELGAVVLDMRERYAKVRQRFAEIDDVLRSEDTSLSAKLIARAKLERSVESLVGEAGGHAERIDSYVTLARNLSEMVPVERLLDGLQYGDVGVSKVVAKLVGSTPRLLLRLRLRALHGTKKTYLQLTGAGIRRLAAKHFNAELTGADTARLNGFHSLVQSLMAIGDQVISARADVEQNR